MRINTSHPSFIAFLDEVTKTILSNVSASDYFKLSSEKKIGVQYAVFKLLKTATNSRAKFTESEVRGFVNVLRLKNERSENYEFAAILKDIYNDFDKIKDATIKPTTKKTVKKIRTENE